MNKKVTMQTIADELNLSKSLVSKALSNSSSVSEETKDKIRSTAIKRGYRFFSAQASSMILNRTGNIAVLLPRQDLLDFEYWGSIFRGIEKELSKKTYSMILSGIDISLKTSDGIPSCISDKKVDGAIILGLTPLSYVSSVESFGIPIVLLDSLHSQLKLDHVLADNYGGGYDAAQYLLERGHRHLGFVGDIQHASSFSERYRGFLAAIKDYEVREGDKQTVIYHLTDGQKDNKTPLSISQVEECMRKEIRPTALVCGNDPVAFSILQSLDQYNLTCPNDVSLIGFDNLSKSELFNPPLTSIDASKNTMGKRAVQLLFRRMEDAAIRPERVIVITEIVERGSVIRRIK